MMLAIATVRLAIGLADAETSLRRERSTSRRLKTPMILLAHESMHSRLQSSSTGSGAPKFNLS
jgi:hypothetical protein